MTKQESILISAYTGFMITETFSEVHSFIEQTLDRPVFTHELASTQLTNELREKLKPQILELIKTIKDAYGTN